MAKGFSGRRIWIQELDITVRSIWEGNIAFLLEFLRKRGEVASWEYEPKVFEFVEFGYKLGPFFYRPDFLVTWQKPKANGLEAGAAEWWEVKGREVKGDRTRMRRFKKHYPEDAGRLRVIDADAYRELAMMWSRAVPGWGGSWSTNPKKKPKPAPKRRTR